MNGEKPTVISLFAGTGGSSLGYVMAGFEEILAIDFDENAVDNFKLNFPHVPIWKKDIREMKGEEILRFCNLKKGELDLLDGSPPCQGFSMAGKRKINDERNDLVFHYIRFVDEIHPKIFLMENVPGMVVGHMKGLFNEYLKKMKSLDYIVKVKILNAKYYGVPQSRKRLFFMGVRKDLEKSPVFPSPNPNVIPAIKALKDVKPGYTPPFNDKYAKVWSLLKPGQSANVFLDNGYQNTVKLNPYKPAPTISKLQTGRGYATLTHWAEPRALSIEEAKALHSFPPDFKLKGTYQEQWARIGNSVPPLLVKAIAETIRIRILSNNI